jgi:hypothetical protein
MDHFTGSIDREWQDTMNSECNLFLVKYSTAVYLICRLNNNEISPFLKQTLLTDINVFFPWVNTNKSLCTDFHNFLFLALCKIL